MIAINLQIGTKTNSRKVADLLGILSNPGSLEILEIAGAGTRMGTGPHPKMGITKRQYKARIAELVGAGVLEKRYGRYFQTPFGRILWSKYMPKLKDEFYSGEGS